jgi:hypothetical protein
MSNPVRYILRLLLLLFVQQFVLYQVPPLHQYFSPVLYYVYILWLPFTISRSGLLVVSFITGLALDFFTKTPGMHAAACVLIGYIRPFLINILLPQQGVDFNYREPSATSLGFIPYATYVLVLTLLHHAMLFAIQAFQFGNLSYLVLKTLGTTAISLLLIFVVEIIFVRKQKFITNT